MNTGLDILEVDEFGVEDEDGSEAEVTADGVEEA
jgi:hypothetical protein